MGQLVQLRKILDRVEEKKYYRKYTGENGTKIILVPMPERGESQKGESKRISPLFRTFATEWYEGKGKVMKSLFQFLAALQIWLGIVGLLSYLQFGGEKIPKMGFYIGKKYGTKPSFLICAEYGVEILSGFLILIPVMKESNGLKTIQALAFWGLVNAFFIPVTFIFWPTIRFLILGDTKLADKFYDDPFLMSIFSGVLHLIQYFLLICFFRWEPTKRVLYMPKKHA